MVLIQGDWGGQVIETDNSDNGARAERVSEHLE